MWTVWSPSVPETFGASLAIRFNSLSKHNEIILLTISTVVNNVFFFIEATLHRLEGRKYVKV